MSRESLDEKAPHSPNIPTKISHTQLAQRRKKIKIDFEDKCKYLIRLTNDTF